ncbi:MAG TPA: hypothetical protein VH561_02665 [Micromonosporaceae bacterium]|jgi:hypothetical protein
MTDDITLPVVPTVSTTYAVALSGLPADLDGAVTSALMAYHGEGARALLDRVSQGLLDARMITAETFPRIPVELLEQHGPDPASIAAFRTASHFVVVTSKDEPRWPPVHEVAGRALASALAFVLPGVLVDLRAPKLLDARDTAASTLAEPRLADYVTVGQSRRPGGQWLFSLGLDRFGLPELQSLDVPLAEAAATQQLLLGLAERLRALYYDAISFGATEEVVLPPLLTMSVDDIAAALAVPTRPGGTVMVRLRHADPDSRPRSLIVEPTAGYAAAVATLFDGVPVQLRMTSQQLLQLFGSGSAG